MIVRGALEANGIGHKSDAHHHGDKEVDEAAHAGQKRQQAHDQKKNCIKKNMEFGDVVAINDRQHGHVR